MLEAEGLVVSERNRGAMVRPLSPTEVVDLYGLRIRLESYAVEVATERATEAELGELVAAADAFGDVRRAVDVDSVEGVRAAPRREPALPRRHPRRRAPSPARRDAGAHRRHPARVPGVPHVRRRRDRTLRHRSTTSSSRRCAAATRTGPRRLMAEHIAQGPRRRARRDGVRDTGGDARERRPTPSTGGCATRCSTRSSRATSRPSRRCYAPDMTMWFNVTGQESSREENLAALADGQGAPPAPHLQRPQINTFDDGFVVQYTCNVVAHNGASVALVGVPGGRSPRRQDRQVVRVPRLGQVRARR